MNEDDFSSNAFMAASLKLVTSLDDIIWLSPFLALCTKPSEKAGYACVYTAICLYVAMTSLLLAKATEYGYAALVPTHRTKNPEAAYIYWTFPRVVAVTAGVALCVNAAKEFRQWREVQANRIAFAAFIRRMTARFNALFGRDSSEHHSHDLEDDADSTAIVDLNTITEVVPLLVSVGSSGYQLTDDNSSVSAGSISFERWRQGALRLVLVALCGTLDGMALLAAFLVGSQIRISALVVGTSLSASFIIFASWQLSRYRPFADAVQASPPWVLLAAVAVYVTLGALLRNS